MLLKSLRSNEWNEVLQKLKEIEDLNKGEFFSYPAINWITEKIKSIRYEIEFSIEGMKLSDSEEINEALIREQDHLIEDYKEQIYNMEDELMECSKLYIERNAAMNAARWSHEQMLLFRYRRRMSHEEAMKHASYENYYNVYAHANEFIIHATEEVLSRIVAATP